MTTMTKTTKRVKPVRSATVFQLSDGKPVLALTQDGSMRSYLLTPIPSDFGVAFHLTKSIVGDGQGGEEYAVLLHGKESSCTCPGHTYRSKCKHVDALTALVQSGKLAIHEPEPTPEPEEEKTVEITEQPPPARRQPRPIYTPIPGKEDAYCYGPCGDEDVYGCCAP